MSRTYLNAFGIGVIAGIRSMMAPALVSHKLSRIEPDPLPDSPLHFITSSKTATTFAVLALGAGWAIVNRKNSYVASPD